MADMARPSNMKVTGPGLEQVRDQLRLLAESEVLVGFPDETTERADGEPLTNASIAYIQDNGQPEVNIPARPFMIPGIEAARDSIAKGLWSAARKVVAGIPQAAEKGLHLVGLKAKLSIQNKINEGVPPPLADSTVRARAQKGRKGAKAELERRAKGEAPGLDLAKPLVDSGQLRNAVNYAIRKRTRRS